ncbi:calcium-binding and coiled-coil domain-containing protein 2 isoform 2-T2 [Polymixia lowei]
MEKSTEGAVTESSSFSQVLFNDIPHIYPPSTPVSCHYTLTAAFQPSTRDWVGIFKVGWSTTKDYHTFVWVEPPLDLVQEPVRKQVVFREYYLPKDDSEFYQFCYVDSSGQVKGASTPFCFKNTAEQSVDCSLENDLLVITTQEQVEQSAKEKMELTKELDHMREEMESIKCALKEKQQEVDSLKEQREQDKSELVKELTQMKEQNESLMSSLKEQQQETDRLQSLTHIQEKYDRALVKINMLKEERDDLKREIDIQSAVIAELKPKVREREQELLKLKDNIQLLQLDLRSSEKEKEKLSEEVDMLRSVTHNLDDLNRENQQLRRSLSEQETLQNIPDDDPAAHALLTQLQDARAQLAYEIQDSNNAKRRAEETERELRELKRQMENVTTLVDQTQRCCSKQEMQLTEANIVIAVKGEKIADMEILIEEKENMIMIEKQEKEELARENQTLRRDIEGLHREFADFQAVPPNSLPMRPPTPDASPAHTTSTTTQEQQQDALPDSLQCDNLYETIGCVADTEEEQSLVCRHCQEIFPGITQDELVQHEQSHRVCPFCTLICDNIEQSVFEDHVYSHEL